jgi:hypothetical protein
VINHLTTRLSERGTAVRSTFEMTSTLPPRATGVLVRRRSSYSRSIVPASSIISVLLGVLLIAVSFIDVAGRAAQRYFAVADIVCCVALACFALWRLASWPRIATLACAAVGALVCILQIASL